MSYCDICNKFYKTSKSLHTHNKTYHRNQNVENKCEYCNKSFSTIYTLKRHHKTCKEKQKDIEDINNLIVNVKTQITKTLEKQTNKNLIIINSCVDEIDMSTYIKNNKLLKDYFYIYAIHNSENPYRLKFGYTMNPLKRIIDLNTVYSKKNKFIMLCMLKKNDKYNNLNLYKIPDKLISLCNEKKLLSKLGTNIFNQLKYLNKLDKYINNNAETMNINGFNTLRNAILHDFPYVGIDVIYEYTNIELLTISEKLYKSKDFVMTDNIEILIKLNNLKTKKYKKEIMAPDDVITFGDEINIINMLTEKQQLYALNKRHKCYEYLIKHIHFNSDIPQYQNIVLKDINSEYIYIYNKCKFEAMKLDKFMKIFIKLIYAYIQTLYLKNKKKLKSTTKDMIKKIITRFNVHINNKDSQHIKQMSDDIKLLIFNESNNLY